MQKIQMKGAVLMNFLFSALLLFKIVESMEKYQIAEKLIELTFLQNENAGIEQNFKQAYWEYHRRENAGKSALKMLEAIKIFTERILAKDRKILTRETASASNGDAFGIVLGMLKNEVGKIAKMEGGKENQGKGVEANLNVQFVGEFEKRLKGIPSNYEEEMQKVVGNILNEIEREIGGEKEGIYAKMLAKIDGGDNFVKEKVEIFLVYLLIYQNAFEKIGEENNGPHAVHLQLLQITSNWLKRTMELIRAAILIVLHGNKEIQAEWSRILPNPAAEIGEDHHEIRRADHEDEASHFGSGHHNIM